MTVSLSCLFVGVPVEALDHTPVSIFLRNPNRMTVLRGEELHRKVVLGVEGIRSGFTRPLCAKCRGRKLSSPWI
jgi:hypothetical protein